MRRRAFVGAALAPLATRLFAQAPAPGQRPRTVFETGIDVINLAVSVTDTRDRFVTDLSQTDFVVYEDGIRQEISLFTREHLPISMSLLIDCSASMDDKLRHAQSAATRFVKTLKPQDLAQVVQFNDRPLILQDFTDDLAALENAVARTRAAGATALHNALYVAYKDLAKGKTAELRRRAIVLLSDGEDTASIVSDDQVLELAKKTEISTYVISLRSRSQRDSPSFSQAAYFLTALSRETGGQVHFPGSISELDTVYDRIAEELRTQYNLGYISSNKRKDGKWRRIVVRANGREDLHIRHKLGYFAGRAV